MAHLNHDLNDETPVCISINGTQLTVSPPEVQVWIEKHTRVHWFLQGEGTIDSIKSKNNHPDPFQNDHDYAASKTHVLSDIVVNPQHKGKAFKYNVIVTPKGKKPISIDPEVQVMPYPLKK
jgi:hypothetical protein